MTFYQFNTMFAEYNIGRQMDFNDAMASNTFSYKESSDYKPMLWIEKLNKDGEINNDDSVLEGVTVKLVNLKNNQLVNFTYFN